MYHKAPLDEFCLTAYTDSDFAGDIEIRKSMSDFIIFSYSDTVIVYYATERKVSFLLECPSLRPQRSEGCKGPSIKDVTALGAGGGSKLVTVCDKRMRGYNGICDVTPCLRKYK